MEKKEIKIVGLDLDGTLLTDKKELLPYTKNVIGEALQNGTVVLVATGRPWTGVRKNYVSFGDGLCTDCEWGEDYRDENRKGTGRTSVIQRSSKKSNCDRKKI